jgi:DNA-binding beta-propeller fold protein YncE
MDDDKTFTIEALERRVLMDGTVGAVAAAGAGAGTGAIASSVVPWAVEPPRGTGTPSPTPTPAPTPTPTPSPSATAHRYLYVFDAPKDLQGFQTLKRQIEVFDIDAGHRWVKNIPLPGDIYNIRGVAGNAATGRLYVSYFLGPVNGYQPGGLMCLDISTGAVIWRMDYPQSVVPAPDRFALTPDGRKIYLPSGENGTADFWEVIDASNGNPIGRVHYTTAPHNTIASLDGRYVFLEGQEKAAEPPAIVHTIGVVDTATDTIVRSIGPFRDVVRPFTINGKASLVFATVDNFVGFQVGDVATGRVLYTVPAPNTTQPVPAPHRAHSHGIALTPDERELWVVNGDRGGIDVWDVSRVPAEAPTYITFIKTRRPGQNLAGQPDPAASNDAAGVPAWIASSYDGKYMYAESGDIIDVATHKVIGQLRAETTDSSGKLVPAPYTHSRFDLEVDFGSDGQATHVTDQFGVGRVT